MARCGCGRWTGSRRPSPSRGTRVGSRSAGARLTTPVPPDVTRIVSGGVDGTLRLWTLDGKQPAAPLKGHQGRVWTIAFPPDGTRIVSGGEDGAVRLWALDGKQAAEPLKGH